MKLLWYLATTAALLLGVGCSALGLKRSTAMSVWADNPKLPFERIQIPPQAEGDPPFYFKKVTSEEEWVRLKYREHLASYKEIACYLSKIPELLPVRVAEGFVALATVAPTRESRWRFLPQEVRILETNVPPKYYIAITAP